MDLSKHPTVVNLQSLLQGDLVENMRDIEAAAQDAVGVLSTLSGPFNFAAAAFDGRIQLLQFSFTIPLPRWMLESDPAPFLQNALKGDIRLVLIAAFAGSPIGYPLLALRRAIQGKYGEDATQIETPDLLAMIHGFDDQSKTDNIIDSLYMDVSNVPQDDELRPLIEKMFPQVEEDEPGFKRNNINWTAFTSTIPIPSGGGGGKGGGVRGGGGGEGGNGGGGGIPEDPTEPKELEEPKESKEPTEDSNSFMFVIILLLLCVAAFALIKGNGR